jgi:predicted ATPase/DNA-binding SARP family transcriptional activator
MSGLALFLLGSPRVEYNGEPIALQRRRAVALLAYLAVTGRSHSRDTLAALFWPEHDQSSARAGLRRVVSSLKKTLGEGWLEVDRETVGLNRDADIWLDASELRNRLAESQTHRHPQEEACPACLSSLAVAAALYRDDFLAGFTLRDSPGFDDWQSFETESLRNELARALQRLASGHGGKGEFDPAIAYARRWVALDPLHEPAHRSLMRLYASSGQRAAALRQYVECEHVLQEEVGAQPEEATTQLCQAIREGRELPPFREPIPGAVPTPAAVVRHNLPLQLTPFVGREAILAEIADRLQDPACRLLTLVGPGGSGKTRLALEAAAARLDDFEHGVYFVSLAPLDSVEAIVSTVAMALGLSFYTGAPGRPESQPRQQLLDYLRHKAMLLIMDNFEHLLEGLDLVLEILQTAPKIKMVVTSRARLNLQGEHLLPVPGMDLPEWEAPEDAGATLEDVRQYSAVELFLQSARRAQPGFALADENVADVIRICGLVEGMPLGILLAAAWVGLLSPAEIASEIGQSLDFLEAELRDLPERQRSMRAVFDRSWRLLSEREREVFQRLSVFRGGFTRQAAGQVARAQLRELRALVGKSLLQRDPQGRYGVHELLRQYAAERLAAVPAEWEAAKDRHSAYFAGFLQHREASLRGRDQRRALAEIEAEIENVRVGWYWAVLHGRIEDIDRALESLVVLYDTRGWFQEKEEILAKAAQMLEEESFGHAQDALQSGAPAALVQEGAGAQESIISRRRRLVLGKVLAHQGGACFSLGLREKAMALLQRSLEILRDLGAREYMALALSVLGINTLLQGEGKSLCLEGLAISKEIGSRPGMEMSLWCLGRDAVLHGEYRAAQRLYQERLAVSRELREELVANSLSDLGYVAWCVGEYREARQLQQQSLALSKELGCQYGIADSLLRLGLDALGLMEYGEAPQLFQDSLAIRQEMGLPWFHTEVLLWQGELANALGHYGEAARLAREALSVSQKLAYPDLIARSFQVLGDATYRLGDSRKAREYFLQALETAVTVRVAPLALLTLVGTARLLAAEGEKERASELLALVLHHPASWQWAKDRAAPLIAQLEAELSPDALAAAQERGQARDLEATVADLLVELGQ